MIHARRRGVIAAATAAVLLPLVSGCGGFVAGSMTANIENVAAGDSAEVGSMLVRNAFVLGPPPDEKIPRGGRAAVYVTLVNRGPGLQGTGETRGTPDRLVDASAGKAARSVRIGGGPITIPPDRLVNVTADEGQLVLRGLTRPLSGGESIELTLWFERSGKVSLSLPVLPRAGSHATLSPFSSTAAPEPTGTASPTTSPEAGETPGAETPTTVPSG